MKLPVLEIVRATWRDVMGFAMRHPLALAATLICTAPVDYHLATFLQQADAPWLATAFASVAASAVSLAIWLPCLFAAVRNVVTAQPAPLRLLDLLPATAGRYLGLSLGLNLPALLAEPLISAHPAFALAMVLLGIAAIVLALRTSLAFTALALGLREPNLSSSYRLTAGKTLRLLAILALSLLSIGAPLALIALGVGFVLLDILEPPVIAALLGTTAGFGYLICAVAGAHVYRAMLPNAAAPAQNGRYW